MTKESVINIWASKPDFSPLQSRNTKVRKMVIGDSPTGKSESACLALNDLPAFDVEFRNLTHLFLWSTSGLQALPALPAGMQVLEIRRSLQLASIKRLPTNLESLVIEDCPELEHLPDLGGQRYDRLRELSFARCEKIPAGWLRGMILASPKLQVLDLSGCSQIETLVGDLSPSDYTLDLQKLYSLNLSDCGSLKDIAPLSRFSSLQSLELRDCPSLREFLPVRELVPQLKQLFVSGCSWTDLPGEVCGNGRENVIAKVRAHFADLKAGEEIDAELKVCVLGNGGVGKTQMCRRLKNEKYDDSVLSTHGIQLGHCSIELPGVSQTQVRLNIWDFGGQDIYLGSHALFLQGPAIFLILWNPESEQGDSVVNGLSMRNRPLNYWIEYVKNLAGPHVRILVVHSKCDSSSQRRDPVQPLPSKVTLRTLDFSAKTDLGLDVLRAEIKEVARDLLVQQPLQKMGVGRFRVRNQLRDWLEADGQELDPTRKSHRVLTLETFSSLCHNSGGVSDPEALLDYLHHTGVISYRPPLFDGQIILDQTWALEAVYAVFDRHDSAPFIKRNDGRFTRSDLARHIWRKYSDAEQELFISMMKSCGICFPVREVDRPDSNENHRLKEWEYVVPELLPEWSEVQEKLLGRLRSEEAVVEATAEFEFLHEGVLRGFLSGIGDVAGDAAIYWKYGCWFAPSVVLNHNRGERPISVPILIESQFSGDPGSGAGNISFKSWHLPAISVIEKLLALLDSQPISAKMRVHRNWGESWNGQLNPSALEAVTMESERLGDDPEPFVAMSESIPQPMRRVARGKHSPDLIVPNRPDLLHSGHQEIFISFAWGDDTPEGKLRTKAIDTLEQLLETWGYKPLVDRNQLRNGNLISGFMKRIGRGERVLVILSDKYLKSVYCMTELYYIYQRSLGEKEEFLNRVIPVVLDDAKIDDWRNRRDRATFWRMEYEEMDASFKDLGVEDRRACTLAKKWHLDIGDILHFISDKLSPRTWEAISASDFAVVHELLTRTSPSPYKTTYS